MAMSMRLIACAVLGSVLVASGCGNAEKDATEAAINAAQAAVNAVKDEAQKYVPDQVQAAQNALTAAREKLAKGDYRAALYAAKDAAKKAREMAAAAAAKNEEWTKTWKDLNESLPRSMDAVKAKIDAYSHGARMPEGMDKGKLPDAKQQYEEVKRRWAEASDLAKQGNWGEALEKATAAREILGKLKDLLEMK